MCRYGRGEVRIEEREPRERVLVIRGFTGMLRSQLDASTSPPPLQRIDGEISRGTIAAATGADKAF